MNIKKLILDKIKEYNKIIILRHVSPDPDAIGSQTGLGEIIRASYPEKNVFCGGVLPERLSYINPLDKIDDDVYVGALCIITDTANAPRIDDSRYKDADFIIKIDHHPNVDEYADLEWVDHTFASTSEMITELYIEFKDELKLPDNARKALFAGIVADTGRFQYPATSMRTFDYAKELIGESLDFVSIYEQMYARPLAEVRLQGYIAENLIVTENGLGYIKITDDLIQKFGVEAASASNMVSFLGNINEIIVWVFLTEDKQQGKIRGNIRSRGPHINEIAQKHGGGGHALASGVRYDTFEEAEALIADLDRACLLYKSA